MDLKMIKISPAVAAEMLEQNTTINRHPRPTHVAKLVNDMKSGLWDSSNGESLKFLDPKEGQKWGEMVDGQHRCMAIIQSGMTFELPCMFGVSEDAYITIDTGSSRTMADLLKQRGYASNTQVAGALVCLEQFYQGTFRGRKTFSHRVLLRRFEEHQHMQEFANDANRLRKVLRPSEAIFISYCLQSIAPKVGSEFIHQLAHGGAEEGNPVHEVRERLLNLRIKKSTGVTHLPRDYVIGSVFKAWNMIRSKSNEPFTMLALGEDIEYPVGFAKYFTDIEIGGIER